MQFYQKLFKNYMEKIIIYTDGSCLGNPGAGGWGALIQFNEEEIILRGGEPSSTNNRMEMKAILEALKWLKDNAGDDRLVEIYSDSNLVVQSIKEGWKRKKNLDIWEEIDKAIAGVGNIDIEWHWVKGHSDNHFNERVDRIAVEESKKQPKGGAVKVEKSRNGEFYCKKCKKNVKGVLSFMPDSGMIRVDCEKCGSYIMFGEKTKANLKRAKKRVLISKDQLEKVLKIKEEHDESVSENDLKKIKTWTAIEADNYINEDQKLF